MNIPTMSMLPGASEWCQRSGPGRVQSWRHRRDGGFNSRRYDVAPVSAAVGRQFVANLHYLGTWPAVRLAYGLYEGGELVGVGALAVPTNKRVLTNALPDLQPYTESLDLARLVLREIVPANAESWFVAQALRLAAGEGIRAVTMCSDPTPQWRNGQQVTPGHVGIVYQALNATYLGQSAKRTVWVLPDGSVLNGRTASKITGGEQGCDGAAARLVALGAPAPGGSLRNWDHAARAAWLKTAKHVIGAHCERVPGNHGYSLWTTPAARRAAGRAAVRSAAVAIPYPKKTHSAPRTRGSAPTADLVTGSGA